MYIYNTSSIAQQVKIDLPIVDLVGVGGYTVMVTHLEPSPGMTKQPEPLTVSMMYFPGFYTDLPMGTSLTFTTVNLGTDPVLYAWTYFIEPNSTIANVLAYG